MGRPDWGPQRLPRPCSILSVWPATMIDPGLSELKPDARLANGDFVAVCGFDIDFGFSKRRLAIRRFCEVS